MGTGSPMREIMFSEDLADAICYIHSLEKNAFHNEAGSSGLVNIGSGDERTIYEFSKIISHIMNFKGNINFNSDFPDGTPRKRLDSDKLMKLGWSKKYTLEQGLSLTIDWYYENIKELRK